MKLQTYLLLLIFPMALISIGQEHLKHSQWTSLLTKYVDDKGMVNYKGFKKEEATLDKYLAVLSDNHPTSSWSKDDQLAFWINAYNAFTVKLIVKNYPVKSIKELGGSIYRVNTPWDIKFIKIGKETYDLNNIEHNIIRKEFNEPRIHFALNCASASCPPLRKEAYVGSKLEKQLSDQSRVFINDKSKNKIGKDKAELSKLFTWFKGDFTAKHASVQAFINQYSTSKITDKTAISYLEYSWDLNESKQ
jgi:hypothetical protein